MATTKPNMKRTLDFNDLLDPANEGNFTTIPADVWNILNFEAQKLINIQEEYLAAKMEADKRKNAGDMHVEMPKNAGEPAYMVEHWRSIRKGVVPFGLGVDPVKPVESEPVEAPFTGPASESLADA